jgi:hypothetical protein
MSNAGAQPHGVMEGKGSYNKHARLPAGGAALAMPLLEKAVQTLELDPREQPIVIADYGSSQGKNSMIPMQVAIQHLRRRVGPNRAIFVFHIDQPSNDFATLFAVLGADPDRYVVDEPNVFPAAIGRSFYENVLPSGSVHLGWSSYAAVWLSRIPTLIPGHFFPAHSTETVRAEFDRQGAQDWEAFLSLRAKELRPGGRLVVVLPGLADDGSSGFQSLFNDANAVLQDMVSVGEITAEERSRMVVGSYPRRKCTNFRTPPGTTISAMETSKLWSPSTPFSSALSLSHRLPPLSSAFVPATPKRLPPSQTNLSSASSAVWPAIRQLCTLSHKLLFWPRPSRNDRKVRRLRHQTLRTDSAWDHWRQHGRRRNAGSRASPSGLILG